jgi:hypothetical protein
LLKELSARLTEEFGSGFSPVNLSLIRKFFLTWRDRAAGLIFQTASEKLLTAPISQKPSAKLAIPQKEYQLYLPSKELLRQKLLDWTRDQEGKA